MAQAATYRKTHQGTVPESKRYKNELLRSQLEIERASFIPTYQDISNFISPHKAQFDLSDVNRGDIRSTRILDSTATESAEMLTSVMFGGTTSPARKWFRLSTQNPWLKDLPATQSWLYTVEEIFNWVLLKSNFYQSMPSALSDVINPATSCLYVEENMFEFDRVIHTEVFPIGSYFLSTNRNGHVDCIVRDLRMTIRQLIEGFGKIDLDGDVTNWENFSAHVRDHWENCRYEQWIDLCHVIKPNPDYDPRKAKFSKYKKYISQYYERGLSSGSNYPMQGVDDDKLLSEKGYDYFPVLVFRWKTVGQTAYGVDSPGWRALPDVKQLQQGEKFSLQGIEKSVKPPLLAPTTARTTSVTQLPGDITYDDSPNAQQIKALFQLDPRTKEIEYKQEQVRARIKKIYKEDLFLSVTNLDSVRSATEINARDQEKTLAFGPVLLQMDQELNRFIDILFSICLNRGMIPEPPEELQGQQLKVEYVSPFHSAQKLISLRSMEGFIQFCLALIPVAPEAADSINFQGIIEEYGDISSLAPGLVRSAEEVQAIQAQRQQAMQQQQQMEMLHQGSQTAKNLANAPTDGDTALSKILNQ